MPTANSKWIHCHVFQPLVQRETNLWFSTQALNRNFIKILYIIICQSVLYLCKIFQGDQPGNMGVNLSHCIIIITRRYDTYTILILCLCFGAVFSHL